MTPRPYSLEPLAPFGALVHGLRLNAPSAAAIAALRSDVAIHGYLVLRNQTLPGDALRRASLQLGELAVAHTCHAEAVHCDVLRLSNREAHGIRGVGPQWHADGSFERRPFSHVLFHAQQMPAGGAGGTEIASAAAAYDALPAALQDRWSRLASVNAYSGAVHPLVHRHPLTGRKSLYIHLGQTGAVIRWPRRASGDSSGVSGVGGGGGGGGNGSDSFRSDECEAALGLEAMDPRAGPRAEAGHTLLGARALRALARRIDAVLRAQAVTHTYAGASEVLLLDNLASLHRAAADAHDERAADARAGLRVLDRTTLRGTHALDPPAASGLAPFAYIWGAPPLLVAGRGGGVWQGSDHWGAGFRWNRTMPMRNRG